jgi:hypothetical protein
VRQRKEIGGVIKLKIKNKNLRSNNQNAEVREEEVRCRRKTIIKGERSI